MPKKNLLLIDFSNILMRGLSVHQDLTAPDGAFTGGIYGFLQIVTKSIIDCDITHVVVCKDSPPYHRHYETVDYKGGRNDDIDIKALRKESVSLLDQFLEIIQWPCLAVPGFEADDLIAGVVRDYSRDFDTLTVASNDSDLIQCLDERGKVRLLKKNGALQYTWKHLMQEWDNLPLSSILTCHAMMGTHNNIRGIHGIGPVKARKLVKIPRLVAELNAKHDGLIDRNLELIKLPHPQLVLPTVSWGMKYNFRQVCWFLDDLAIQMTANMDTAFAQLAPKR